MVREGQENEGDMSNRQAEPNSAAPEPAQKEPEAPCPNRCAMTRLQRLAWSELEDQPVPYCHTACSYL